MAAELTVTHGVLHTGTVGACSPTAEEEHHARAEAQVRDGADEGLRSASGAGFLEDASINAR